jgi:hypothetical protein
MENPGAHLIPRWPHSSPSDPIEVHSFLHPWPSTPSGNSERRRASEIDSGLVHLDQVRGAAERDFSS